MHVARVLQRHQGVMTQQQFAALLGLSQSTLSQIYSGARHPARETIAAFLRCFPQAALAIGEAQLADAQALPLAPPAEVS
jgi:transcriptional regulator with XRE-family HTH domain